jgi:D-alanyl-D-alanine carboxypeptidase
VTGAARPSLRVVGACLLLAIGCVACGPPSVLPTPTPSTPAAAPPSPTATPTPDLLAPTVVAQDPPPDGHLSTIGSVQVTFSEPVSGVDRASFQLSDASGAVVAATIILDPAGRIATLLPAGLTIASTYTATLTGLVRDRANNALAPTSWSMGTGNQVAFAAGAYTGYQFGATSADLTAVKRATLARASGATASEYRVIDGAGYLLIDAGIWQGYWVPGNAAGTPLDDLAAPIPPLPTCAYVDLPARRSAYADWGVTVLDTVFLLPRGYVPPDLVDTAGAGLNAGQFIRSIAQADLSAMVAAAKADGARLAVQSGYRSYAGQVLTFNGWVSQVGYRAALQTSARPGHSEHQLGTAIDFRTVGGASPWTYADWETTTEGGWLAANAWRFGWLTSYPKGMIAVSCYRYEPWHYRYVGRQAAAEVHAAGMTLREWLWARGDGVR